ncbi:Hsp20/alpha crystallin family protein [Dictyocaulus viviparus]|uniref:Hsp20/alpha crystallin family protein n=1 Tax=Dictyocaulus viviparus TaxID=29172 RepID=A0A0D8Y7P8_DICVI|nr:Hsp20/alpha crystallin family protein [Dictyocaulus viviparus]
MSIVLLLVEKEKNDSRSCSVSFDDPLRYKVNIVDNTLIIEGKHDEKRDKFGKVERHFVRKYELPNSVKCDEVKSELSRDGILTVKYERQLLQHAKVVPITVQPRN